MKTLAQICVLFVWVLVGSVIIATSALDTSNTLMEGFVSMPLGNTEYCVVTDPLFYGTIGGAIGALLLALKVLIGLLKLLHTAGVTAIDNVLYTFDVQKEDLWVTVCLTLIIGILVYCALGLSTLGYVIAGLVCALCITEAIAMQRGNHTPGFSFVVAGLVTGSLFLIDLAINTIGSATSLASQILALDMTHIDAQFFASTAVIALFAYFLIVVKFILKRDLDFCDMPTYIISTTAGLSIITIAGFFTFFGNASSVLIGFAGIGNALGLVVSLISIISIHKKVIFK